MQVEDQQEEMHEEEHTAEVALDDEQHEGDEQEGEQQEAEAVTNGDDDEVVVTIGDEQPKDEERAPDWVRELRKNYRDLQKENRALKERATASDAGNKPAALGKKPALDDFDYDSEKYEEALTAWYDKKREADKEAERIEQVRQQQERAWQGTLENYAKQKTELKVSDYEDAEAVVQDLLSVTQQGIILQGADNAALVAYALGKNPAKAKELSAISDPVKFSFAISKFEDKLKVTNRKSAPPPEKKLTGTAPSSGSVDSTLNRLRADAEKSGDYSKVMEYRRKKRAA